jgi:type II secretory pathway component PulK
MRREGLVLIAVLVVVALGAMIAAGVLFRMTAEVAAGAAGSRGQQAFAAAMSGLQQAIVILQTHGDAPETWYDNPDLFRNQLVYDGGTNRWYFTIYAHNPMDEESVRYGVTDEAGKINLNTATEQVLLELPNMTSELVDCLLDYRDSDD